MSSIILMDESAPGFGLRLRRYEDGSLDVQTGGFGEDVGSSYCQTFHLDPEQVEQVRVFLGVKPAQPAKPEPLPAWRERAGGGFLRALASDKGGHNALAAAFPSGNARTWAHPGALSCHGSIKATPSVWHAMHAADAALLAAGHTLTDPAPEPPDIGWVHFGAWVEGRYPCGEGAASDEDRRSSGPGGPTASLTVGGCFRLGDTIFPAITTREAADAFLRACGATLEEA